MSVWEEEDGGAATNLLLLSNGVFMEKVGQDGLGVLLASGYVMQTLKGSESPPRCVSLIRNDVCTVWKEKDGEKKVNVKVNDRQKALLAAADGTWEHLWFVLYSCAGSVRIQK